MKTPERRNGRASLPRVHARPTALCVAILAAAFSDGAGAARLNYRLELLGLHSDNINLSESDEQAETVFAPRIAFDFKEEGAAVEVQARGEVERRIYSGNEFDDETRSGFAGQLNWSLFPERLNLVVEDYLSEEPINFRDGRFPGNLQQVNVLVGGPTFFARFGDATRLKLDLRGADTYAEETPGFDSTRYGAAAALEHDIRSTSKISLNLAYTKVDFHDSDPATATDYDREDGFVRYNGKLRNIDYELDGGYSRLKRDLASDESTAIGRATIQWQPDPHNRLRFRARHQFADEVQDLVLRLRDSDEALIPGLIAPSDSLVTSGVYRQDYLDLDYRFSGERFGFRARPLYRKLRYIDREDSDRTERALVFQASYRLRPRMTVMLDGAERRREFLTRDETDRDHVYGLAMEYQLTRHWGWRADLFKNDRSSDAPEARYKENAAQFTVWWQR
jgi:hypothetical protein